MSPKKTGKLVAQYMARIAMPPTRWLKAMNFSAAKLRSANWEEKKMPTMEAMAKAVPTQAVWLSVKLSPSLPM
jgi:hypothetical protein